MTEHFEFQHQLHNLIVKWDPSVLAVLTYHRRDKYRLILQLDIPHSYFHELDGPYHRVILEVAGQQEPLICLSEVCGHTLHVWYRQWLPELFLHWKNRDLRYRIVREILLFQQPGAESGHPCTVIVSRQSGSLTVEKDVIQEVSGQCRV